MSFDGVFTHCMVNELNDLLFSGRVSKVQQPYDNEIILVVRSHGKNYKLLLSAHSSYARIQLTDIPYQNPSEPNTFCMMLRKHIDGSILTKIEQQDNDRIVHLSFTKRNELGDDEMVYLAIELMGRHSNIVLVNRVSNKIIDCIKHVGMSQNSYRLLLPGADYLSPPEQTTYNPFSIDDRSLFSIIHTNEEINKKYLQQRVQGLGPDTADEIASRINNTTSDKLKAWRTFFTSLDSDIQPTLTNTDKKSFFTPLNYASLNGEKEHYSSLSHLLDAFYEGKAEKDRVKQQGGELIRKIEQDKKKNESKVVKLVETLEEAENAEIYRQKGELLTTFLHEIERGSNSVTLNNYYEEDEPIQILLDPALSPPQNAQKYFHKYQKLKGGESIVKEQLEQTEQEILYLESVLSQLELATPKDVQIVREELIEEGYIRTHQKGNKQKKQVKSQPDKFLSTDGIHILVGKNNLQNDQLTLRTAKKTDTWLHVKNIPGSHVIIQSSAPTEETLIEAAELAAYFSKFRLSSNVPVDYTLVKNVHKPNGSKPGYVIYDKQKTLYVTPTKELVEKLQQ